MRSFSVGILFFLVGASVAQHGEFGDLDPLDGFDEKEFEEYFHLDPVEDPEEFEKRNEALKKNEEEIKKVNEAYQEGNATWFDGVNEFSDLTDEEFLSQKTGAIIPDELGRGLLEPADEDRVDEESERYFARLMKDRQAVPVSYSSVDMGLVSPVKNQQQCGSCVAFSSMAAIETCFRKITGVFGDYSEQQLVDCGYQQNNANGCHGAPPHAYLTWAASSKLRLAHESQYPYLNEEPKLSCPANLPVHNQGARISDSYYTYNGNEELLKQLVFKHGAVVASVKSKGEFENYKGGLFAGCPPTEKTDHAITVVGYGRENGIDYWLIKNSWGPTWGENGFIKMKRGVNMCGIGKSMAAVLCEKVAGPTDAPLTTAKPCVDNFGNCPELAATACYQDHIAAGCGKSCGLCAGMTPARSYTCYNKFSNCPQLTQHCSDPEVAADCKLACRKC